MTAAEIAEVEARYGVELPKEYRTFLAEVGAGGPGPFVDVHGNRHNFHTWYLGWLERSGREALGSWVDGPGPQ
nr:SMI1/KNR4 family protein [Streptomyces malaysiense]